MARLRFHARTIALGLTACVCFGQALSTNAQRVRKGDLSARDIAQRSFPSVVVLVAEDRSGDQVLGSGFFIDNNIIATNYHVVKGATKIVARSVGAKERQ
jgi:S1-C subfamily serine protease